MQIQLGLPGWETTSERHCTNSTKRIYGEDVDDDDSGTRGAISDLFSSERVERLTSSSPHRGDASGRSRPDLANKNRHDIYHRNRFVRTFFRAFVHKWVMSWELIANGYQRSIYSGALWGCGDDVAAVKKQHGYHKNVTSCLCNSSLVVVETTDHEDTELLPQ